MFTEGQTNRPRLSEREKAKIKFNAEKWFNYKID